MCMSTTPPFHRARQRVQANEASLLQNPDQSFLAKNGFNFRQAGASGRSLSQLIGTGSPSKNSIFWNDEPALVRRNINEGKSSGLPGAASSSRNSAPSEIAPLSPRTSAFKSVRQIGDDEVPAPQDGGSLKRKGRLAHGAGRAKTGTPHLSNKHVVLPADNVGKTGSGSGKTRSSGGSDRTGLGSGILLKPLRAIEPKGGKSSKVFAGATFGGVGIQDSSAAVTAGKPRIRIADSDPQTDFGDPGRTIPDEVLDGAQGGVAAIAHSLTKDTRTRRWYKDKIKRASDEMLRNAAAGDKSVQRISILASKQRIQIIRDARKMGSAIGRAFAQRKKHISTVYDPIEFKADVRRRLNEYSINDSYSTQDNKAKIKSWEELIKASGRDNVKVTGRLKLLEPATKVLWVATAALAAYNVIDAEDPVRAGLREAGKIGGGILGGAAGGGLAGLLCGPGAPICSTIGVFIGGFAGALGVDLALEEIEGLL